MIPELILTVFFIILVYKYSFNYWNEKRIKNIKPSFLCVVKSIFGSHEKSIFKYYASIYEQLSDEPYGGCYKNLKPQLVLRDPALIRRILFADFHYFQNRGSTAFDIYDKFTYSLFSLPGDSLWKETRKNVLASFSTITKTKSSFKIIDKRADTFVEIIKRKIDDDGHAASFDIENLSVNFAIEVISSTIFGLETSTMLDEENCKFKRISSIMFVNNNKQWLRKQIENFAPFLSKCFPIFRLSIVPDEVRTFFRDLVRNLPPTSIFADQTKAMDLDLMAAQIFIFFAAGFRPVSFLIAMAIMELAKHREFQTKLRDELESCDQPISSEIISKSKLPFLDNVIRETLRKYPTIPILSRICTEPYRIPDTKLIIEKGTEAIVPLAGLHYDEKYFEKPEDFNPERTFPEDCDFTYLPFGKGQRQCIAIPFSKIVMKTAVARLIKTFTFEVANETIYPVLFDSNKLFTRSAHPIVVKCRNTST